MGMEEWIKEQQRRYLDEPRLKELTEVMKQTRVLVRKKEYRKLTELVRRYRKSEDVITQVSCLLSASYLFPTPEKTVETESEDEFAQSANAVKAMKQEGAFSLSRVKRIAFVCDAGMGSSAMGATTFRKRLEKAGLAIEVKHYAIENVPADADIVVTHASLEGRVKRVTDKPLILINNYIGDPKLDTLFNQLTAEHKH